MTTTTDRREQGRSLRADVPRSVHGDWSAAARTRDPVAVLEQQAATRVAELVPVRYERMAESPFAFYRGAAAVMAMDLATTPVTGLSVQACGDAHVANFGTFATPERNVIFDINDFDETDPGPWEWDVKRLAASLHVVALQHGFRAPQARPGRDHRGHGCTASTSTSTPRCAPSTSGTTAPPPPTWSSTSLASTASRRERDVAEALRKDHLRAVARLTTRHRGSVTPSSRTRRSWCTSRPQAPTWTTSPRCSTTTARRSATSGASCSTASGWSTSPDGWSASAASGPGAGSACSRRSATPPATGSCSR